MESGVELQGVNRKGEQEEVENLAEMKCMRISIRAMDWVQIIGLLRRLK